MHATKVHFLSKTVQYLHVKLGLDTAQIFTYHLLGKSFTGDKESGNSSWRIFQESPLDQVSDALVQLLVENIEASPVVTFTNDFVDGVHVAHHFCRTHDG